MKIICRRVFNFFLAILLVILMLPLGSIPVYADEAEGDDTDAFGENSYKVGDIINFGHYEQDGDETNGKEEVEWEVLSVENDKMLVVSKYVLDYQPYNFVQADVGWESCSLRSWLNNHFYDETFSSDEKSKICASTIVNSDDPLTGTSGGNDTVDKVFCLSVDEIKTLFGEFGLYSDEKMWGYNAELICSPTQYAMNKGGDYKKMTLADLYDYKYNPVTEAYDLWLITIYPSSLYNTMISSWWLRSPIHDGFSCEVSKFGTGGAGVYFYTDSDKIGVRPAMYINLSNDKPDPIDPNPGYPKKIKYKAEKDNKYYEFETFFEPSILAKSSYSGYNERLAEICAILSQAVYHDNRPDEDKLIFDQMGINGYKSKIDNNLSYCYSIGYDSMMINGKDTAVFFFVMRGTKTDEEKIVDWSPGYNIWNNGIKDYFAYNYCIEFANQISDELKSIYEENPELRQKPTKAVCTGHSLGGAAANLIGAMLSDAAEIDSMLSKEDIFVYTFGAIDSIPTRISDSSYPYKKIQIIFETISAGYENIHNVYNFNDTFGPHGWWFFTAAGNSGVGKFGHIDIFSHNPAQGINMDDSNHDMLKTYIPAVFGNWIKHDKYWRIVSMHCPVDIQAYQEGVLVSSIVDNKIDETVTTIPTKVIGDQKYFLIAEDADISFKINATGEGEMIYDIEDAATGSVFKEFQSVQLSQGKNMISYVDSQTENEEIKLFAENESGKIVTEILEDGEEIPATVQSIFKDVKDGAWYVPAVQYAYDNDIMTGKGNQKFAPNANLHREEFTQMLYKNEGAPEISISDNPFTDVKNAWYKTSVLWAKEQGIVSGKSVDRFGIGNNITREELALMLYKYAQYKNFNVSASDDLSGFTDSDKVSSWALDAVKWAVANGIISGKGSVAEGFRIDPQKGATRAECAAMMKKFAETDFNLMQTFMIEEEEPLALPMEEIEDIPVPEEEAEDIIEDEDAVPEDKEEEDTVDHEDVAPETEIEELTETEDTDS